MPDTNSTVNSAANTSIILGFLMSLLAFFIVVGNAVVILAFMVDKNLRHRSNYFFLNLAISDFFVGAISIPLYIPHTLFKWDFGKEICLFWLVTDYLLCTASVYNIVLISYDRYQSVLNAVGHFPVCARSSSSLSIDVRVDSEYWNQIRQWFHPPLVLTDTVRNTLYTTTQSVTYRAQNTGILKIVIQMVAVWVLAFLVNGPMILVSEAWKNGSHECEPGFFSAWYVIAITSLLEFLIPVIAVAYFNVYIYRRLWKRGNLTKHRGRFLSVSSCESGQALRWGLFSEEDPSLHSQGQGRKSSFFTSFRSQKKSKMIHASKGSSLAHADSLSLHHKEHVELLRSRKLAKSLAVLLAVFAICWAPYSLFTIVISTYPPAERPKSSWYEFAFWLQWFNSFINPVLYPLCHKRFQKAFLKLFCVKKQLMTSQSQSFSSSR